MRRTRALDAIAFGISLIFFGGIRGEFIWHLVAFKMHKMKGTERRQNAIFFCSGATSSRTPPVRPSVRSVSSALLRSPATLIWMLERGEKMENNCERRLGMRAASEFDSSPPVLRARGPGNKHGVAKGWKTYSLSGPRLKAFLTLAGFSLQVATFSN